jgi:hypothetical protein
VLPSHLLPALALAVAGSLALTAPVRAQGMGTTHYDQEKVQLTPMAAWGFGGSVDDLTLNTTRSFKAAPLFGGALDIKVASGWNVELYYTRQSTEVTGGLAPGIDVTLERYLIGLQEEKGDERFRWFGTFYGGVTRFVPGIEGFGSDRRFTAGIGLGAKAFLSKNVGVRLEARGFYTVVEAEGGFLCSGGTCLFAFNGSGLWQGDVGGGLILAF